jgi:hypothetical protein
MSLSQVVAKEIISIPTNYGSLDTKVLAKKNGLVVHKGAIDLGSPGKSRPQETKHYKVSHASTGSGLSLGDGFKKKKTAVEYMDHLSSLHDWTKVNSKEDVTKELAEKAMSKERTLKEHEQPHWKN